MEPVFGYVGQKVEKGGTYICGNCGNYQVFHEEDEFEPCSLCGDEDSEWELEE